VVEVLPEPLVLVEQQEQQERQEKEEKEGLLVRLAGMPPYEHPFQTHYFK
jgi:hypothetical protein